MSTILFNIFNSSTSELPSFSVEIWAEGRLYDFIHARLPSPFEIPNVNRSLLSSSIPEKSNA